MWPSYTQVQSLSFLQRHSFASSRARGRRSGGSTNSSCADPGGSADDRDTDPYSTATALHTLTQHTGCSDTLVLVKAA